ncbi:MAG TPA: FAD-binding domain [Gemmatimonadaceae bacterium]|nr:FAD-binding domain [Gemmatimonadaceae bacterium]
MDNRNILISGAGIAGPTLAYWLLERGFTPTIVERAPALRTGGYVVDFWGVGYDVAERMKLLPALYEDGYLIDEVRLVDSSGKRITGFDARLVRKATGNRFVSVMRSDLSRRIYDLIDGRVETIFGDTITSISQDRFGVSVTFQRTEPRRFDLVVGADGLHSRVRSLAFGNSGSQEKYLGYYVAAFTADNYPHRDESAYVSYSVPCRTVARYALRGNRSAFFFIFSEGEMLDVYPHDVAKQKAILSNRFSDVGWECPEILAALGPAADFYFDSCSQMRMPEWSRGRVVLVGDAAYCPSLLAGEGSGLAMAGAYALTDALCVTGENYLAGFARYQDRFKPFVDKKQRAATRMAWWFAPRTKWQIRMRDIATDLMNTPYLGERLIARSFADSYQLPA